MALTLTEDRRSQLDSIVGQMEANGEAEDDIRFVVDDFRSKYGAEEAEKPFFDFSNTVGALKDAVGGLGVTVPAAYRQLREGLVRPDQYTPEARKAFEDAATYQEMMALKTQIAQQAGDSDSVSESIREAGNSLGFSVASMGASALAGAGTGALVGSVVPGAGTAAGGTAGTIAGVGAGMLASGTAAYRMAGAQFLNDAFEQLEKTKGSSLTEEEKASAYQELLPVAQNTALWEAGPEAIGNAVTLGAGKVALGVGKPLITSLAKTALGKAGVRVGAGAAAVGTELATETVTQVEQRADDQKAQQYAAGQEMTAEPDWSAGGVATAFKEVAPQTLALVGMMGGTAGAVKATVNALRPAQTEQAPAEGVSPVDPLGEVEPDMPDMTGEQRTAEEGVLNEIRRQAEAAAAAPNPIVDAATIATETAEATASVAPETAATLASIAEQTAVSTLASDPAGLLRASIQRKAETFEPFTEEEREFMRTGKVPAPTPSAAQITPGGVQIGNVDSLLSNGGGVVEVIQNGQRVPFDKFGLTIDGETAEVAFVEIDPTKAGKGIGTQAYVALGKALAEKGITLQSSAAQYAKGRKLWQRLVDQGFARQAGNGRFAFVSPEQTAVSALTAQPETTDEGLDSRGTEEGLGTDSGGGLQPTGPVEVAASAQAIAAQQARLNELTLPPEVQGAPPVDQGPTLQPQSASPVGQPSTVTTPQTDDTSNSGISGVPENPPMGEGPSGVNTRPFSTYLRTVTPADKWTDSDYTAAEAYATGNQDFSQIAHLPRAKQKSVTKAYYIFNPEAAAKQAEVEAQERKRFAERNRERPDDATTLESALNKIGYVEEQEEAAPAAAKPKAEPRQSLEDFIKSQNPDIEAYIKSLGRLPLPDDIESASIGGRGVPRYADVAYLAAVEAGRLDDAQRMVDQAAREAGYESKLFHGTTATETIEGDSSQSNQDAAQKLKDLAARIGLKDWNGITSLYQRLADNGLMGVTQEDAANAKKWQKELNDGYSYTPAREKLAFTVFQPASGELELGVHLGNESAASMFGESFPFHVKLGKSIRLPDLGTWNYQSVIRELRKRGVKISEAEYDSVFNARDNNKALRELLKSKGISSVVYRNEAEGRGDSHIVFDPEQIKDASPVVRDDAGNVIPLSKRFNPQSDDIRYSLGDDAPSAPLPVEQARQILADAGITNFDNIVFGNYAPLPNDVTLKGFVRQGSNKVHINLNAVTPENIVDVFNEEATHLVWEDKAVAKDWARLRQLVPQDQLDALRAEMEERGYVESKWDEEAFNDIARKLGYEWLQQPAWRRLWESLKAAVKRIFGLTDSTEINRVSARILSYAIANQQSMSAEAGASGESRGTPPFDIRAASIAPDEKAREEAFAPDPNLAGRQQSANFTGTPQAKGAAAAVEAGEPVDFTVEQTQARFQPADPNDRDYVRLRNIEGWNQVQEFLSTTPLDKALEMLKTGALPDGLRPGQPGYEFLGAELTVRLTSAIDSATDEFVKAQLTQASRQASILFNQSGTGTARSLQARVSANARLRPFALILAAHNVLIERMERIVKRRFPKGDVVEKVRGKATQSSQEAGENVGRALNDEEGESAEDELNKAQQTAESILTELAETHSDPMGWRAKGKPNPVRALYYKHLRAPMQEAQFVEQMIALEVDEARARQLWTTSQLEINARNTIRSEAARQRAEDAAVKRASRLIYRTEERLRQGSKDLSGSTDGDTINKAFRDQVLNPMEEAAFIGRLAKLNVNSTVARRLLLTAKREAADRAAMEVYRAEQTAARRVQLAEKRASQLIYKTEERLRQGSKDLKSASNKDTINKAFREQVEDPSEWDTFRERLAKLEVGEDVAARLFRTAEREALDQQAMADYREKLKLLGKTKALIAQDSKPLADLINTLRKKMFPGMNWTDIFTDLPEQERMRKTAILERLRKHEALRDLSNDEITQLGRELDKAWQRERRKVFLRELEKAGALGEEVAAVDVQRVKNAMPRILRYLNLGLFNSEAFVEAIAPEYGLKPLNDAQRKELRKLAADAWKAPEGVQRNRLLVKILDKMQGMTGVSRMELLESYWISSVLSGSRTQFDTWMAALNGFATAVRLSAMVGFTGKRSSIKVMSEWWKGLGEGARESLQILKGDYTFLKQFDENMAKAMEGDRSFRPVPLGEKVWREGNWWQKFPALVMVAVSRSMAAADHVNNTATTAAAAAAARALHPEIFKGALTPTDKEKADARKQAILEMTGGVEPKTSREKADVTKRTRELLHGLVDPDVQAEFNQIGNIASYQNDPTGVAGVLYNALQRAFGSIEQAGREAAENEDLNKVARAIAGMAAISARSILGVRFARFGLNFASNSTSMLPGTYFLRKPLYGSELSRTRESLILANNLIGLMGALMLVAFFTGDDDEEDSFGLEGSWSGIDIMKQRELRSAGKDRNTFWWRGKDGKMNRISYKQWEIGALFAAAGSWLDKRKYRPSDYKNESGASHFLGMMAAGMLHVKDLSAISALTEILGKSAYAQDPGEDLGKKLNKVAAGWAGGFTPNFLKDVDAWTDPQYYKPESALGAWARGVPLLRRNVEGGRPLLTILGDPVELDRSPWSRVYTNTEQDVAYQTLGGLLARGIWMPQPSTERVVRNKAGDKVKISSLGTGAEWQYQKLVGKKYKDYLKENATVFTDMDPADAEKQLERDTARIRDDAARELEDTLWQ